MRSMNSSAEESKHDTAQKSKHILSKNFGNQILIMFFDICFETTVAVFQSWLAVGWLDITSC
jgi:hypothetical protein